MAARFRPRGFRRSPSGAHPNAGPIAKVTVPAPKAHDCLKFTRCLQSMRTPGRPPAPVCLFYKQFSPQCTRPVRVRQALISESNLDMRSAR